MVNRLIFMILFLQFSQLALCQITFRDMSAVSGINSTGRSNGIAFGDFDNDGYEDIYVAKLFSANLLFRNNGDMTFTEVGKDAGVAYFGNTYTAIWGDMDNDGFLDLYLGNMDVANTFYHNNGDGTFTDLTSQSGVGFIAKPNSIALADIDNDGYLDIYLAHPRTTNVLYHNNGNLTFSNIVNEVGANDMKFSMGSLFFDFDNDNDLDLYLVHDGDEANILLENDGFGFFTDITASAGVAYEGQGMGVDFGDYNRDGFLDLYITNLFENVLYQNNGDGTFTDISLAAGVDDYGMGWGTAWLDYDCDGLQDIYVANQSHFSPYPNVMYRNSGDGTFEIISQGTALESPYSGFAMATADLNNDGGLDIFVANESISESDELFVSDQIENNWVKIKCVGTTANRFGIGARVEVLTNGIKQTDIVTAGSGYCSENSLIIHFGLGKEVQIDQVKIIWPNGKIDSYENLSVNEFYTATEGETIETTAIKDLVTSISPANLDEIEIYPNPFQSKITLRHSGIDMPWSATIYDIHGRTLHKEYISNQTQQVNLEFLPKGIYLVTVETIAGKKLTKKIIKK